MEINKHIEDGKLYVSLTDKLDTVTSQELLEALKEDMTKVSSVEFDFAALNYISSAGLRALLTYQKALGGKEKVRVINANEIVKNIFQVTGFVQLIDVI